jgi:excisionase family DNA binding protein
VLRDPVVEALVAEVDQALITLQTARRLLTELQQSQRATARRQPDTRHADPGLARTLRFTGITVAEAAAVLRLSEEHVRRMLRKGELIGVGFGGRVGWRLSREHVAEMAAALDQQVMGQQAARRKRTSKRRSG